MENDSTPFPGTQLTLLDSATSVWRLDERTRETGRQGVADARRALAVAARQTAA